EGLDAPSHRQGHEAALGDLGDDVEQCSPTVSGGCYVVEDQLVRTLLVVADSQVDRITDVLQLTELGSAELLTTRRAPVMYVQAGDDASSKHAGQLNSRQHRATTPHASYPGRRQQRQDLDVVCVRVEVERLELDQFEPSCLEVGYVACPGGHVTRHVQQPGLALVTGGRDQAGCQRVAQLGRQSGTWGIDDYQVERVWQLNILGITPSEGDVAYAQPVGIAPPAVDGRAVYFDGRHLTEVGCVVRGDGAAPCEQFESGPADPCPGDELAVEQPSGPRVRLRESSGSDGQLDVT